jgi:hypothetical protein
MDTVGVPTTRTRRVVLSEVLRSPSTRQISEVVLNHSASRVWISFLLIIAVGSRVDSKHQIYRRKICIENKVRVLYNDNTFKKNVDSQGNAMACHKDREHVNDDKLVPSKAQ